MDLAIIGGGPAGTAAALEARRRGLDVTIWERDRFPRDKVCGEFLSAECLPWLGEQIPEALARAAVIRRAEFISPRGRVHGLPLPSGARGLSRRVLDRALWERAASSGARTLEGEAVRGLRKIYLGSGQARAWQIEASSGGVHRARALIIACGRWWSLEGFPSPTHDEGRGRPRAGPGTNGVEGWVGAKAHFQGIAPRDAIEMYFFRGGYCGLAPIEDGLCNVCCAVHRNVVRDGGTNNLADFAGSLSKMARHPALEARLRGAIQVTRTLSTAPLRPGRRVAEYEGALLVGDSGGFLDPFTGEGLSIALHSGRLAAEEWAKRWSGRSSAEEECVARAYREHLARAVEPGYWVAGALRSLASAPPRLQTWAAAALPWLGEWLLAATRWRAAP